MSFACIEAKLEYFYGKIEDAGWTISAVPVKPGFVGVRLTRGEDVHDVYVDRLLVERLGATTEEIERHQFSRTVEQQLCASALRVAGLNQHLHWF